MLLCLKYPQALKQLKFKRYSSFATWKKHLKQHCSKYTVDYPDKQD